MKKDLKPNRLLKSIATLSLTVFLAFTTSAYTVVNPSNANNTYVAANTPIWMNNAVYENAAGTVYAVVWDDGSNVYLEIYDGSTFLPVTLVAYVSGIVPSYPDVAIGGDNSGTTAYVTVSYTGNIVSPSSTDIYVEEFAITGIGGTLTATPACDPIRVSSSHDVGKSHIDTKNLLSGTHVDADGFAVGWEDMACSNTTANFGVNACVATYSGIANICGAAVVNAPSCITTGLAVDAVMVDVEYGQIKINSTTNHDMAYFIFVDPASSKVATRKWDVTSNTIVAGNILENNTTAGIAEYPRITGLDPVQLSATQAGIAFTWRYYDGTYWQVHEVNNVNTTVQNLTNAYPSTYSNNGPVIACSPSTLYSVAYQNPHYNDVYVQNINCSNGNVTNSNYYNVNFGNNTTGDLVAVSDDYIYSSGIKTNKFFICWYDATAGDIVYKVTTAASGFKTGPTSVAGTGSTEPWSLSPIPANDILQLKAGSKEGQYYSIIDAMGKTLMQGNITGAEITVNVHELPDGVYILNITNKDNTVERRKFVKG